MLDNVLLCISKEELLNSMQVPLLPKTAALTMDSVEKETSYT